MYTLIIVDDDELIRKGLEKVIQWEKMGFSVLGTFKGAMDAVLEAREDVEGSGRASKVDLSNILNNPYVKEASSIKYDKKNVYDFELEKTVDEKILIKKLSDAMDKKQKRSVEVDVTNTDRALGTLLGAEITRRFGESLAEEIGRAHV